MQTFHVYCSERYLGTITADSLESAQQAIDKALIIQCTVRPTPPPPPTLEHRVGTDGKLYRH